MSLRDFIRLCLESNVVDLNYQREIATLKRIADAWDESGEIPTGKDEELLRSIARQPAYYEKDLSNDDFMSLSKAFRALLKRDRAPKSQGNVVKFPSDRQRVIDKARYWVNFVEDNGGFLPEEQGGPAIHDVLVMDSAVSADPTLDTDEKKFLRMILNAWEDWLLEKAQEPISHLRLIKKED